MAKVAWRATCPIPVNPLGDQWRKSMNTRNSIACEYTFAKKCRKPLARLCSYGYIAHKGTMELQRKLEILSAAAKYDVSCSSSGSLRNTPKGGMGNSAPAGICHSFTEDGRCVSLLKILLTNSCLFDCAYCINRRSNDIPRATFKVSEVVELTLEFYRRNYIEGLFLSSGVLRNPDYTMEALCRVAQSLREEHRFGGYIHLKAIPGASPELIDMAGFYADRLSVNIEIPSESGLRNLAPEKNFASVLGPMGHIRERILEYRPHAQGGIRYHDHSYSLANTLTDSCSETSLLGNNLPTSPGIAANGPLSSATPDTIVPSAKRSVALPGSRKARFSPAGQSTQLIVGASPESDFHILGLANGLYRQQNLKRVYYSGYIPINHDHRLPALEAPPLKRENRLYQSDWLMRFYHFRFDEIVDEKHPHLDTELDPKAAWALRNPHLFPVDLDRADYETILRVPGIGVRSAQLIIQGRRFGKIRLEHLKRMGVALKRARYFIVNPELPRNLQRLYPEQIRSALLPPPPRPRQLHLFDLAPGIPSLASA